MRKYFVRPMPAGVSPIPPLLPYVYAREDVQATTGYFGCELEHVVSPEYCLELLAMRPLDNFLHARMLALLAALADAELADWAATASSPLLKHLLCECAHFFPDRAAVLRDFLPRLAKGQKPVYESSPLPQLLLRDNEDLRANRACGEFFLKNIRDHAANAACPPAFHERYGNLEAVWQELEARRGLLAGTHREMAGVAGRERPAPAATCERAAAALEAAGLLQFPEMRHEASLAPIALLRQWPVNIRVESRRARHTLTGAATAYGRGFSLARARAACLMELCERASAHAGVAPDGQWGWGEIADRATPMQLFPYTLKQLRNSRFYLPWPAARLAPINDVPFAWVTAEDPAGNTWLAPAQSVFLFMNLDEPCYFDTPGSTGLGAGNDVSEARLAALLEIIERDAHATVPFSWQDCFLPRSRSAGIQAILDDYRFKGIYPVMQDITTEIGVPAYRCFVTAQDGAIVQATGAGLHGMAAALAAITETPWPYSALSGQRPQIFTRRCARPLPSVCLEDLPDFGLGSASADLTLLERTLKKHGLTPIYVDITRKDLKIPVVRAFVAGLQTHADFDEISPPPLRLAARWRHQADAASPSPRSAQGMKND